MGIGAREKEVKRGIRQAFILSAGLGTRLRPLTDTMPKVMIPIEPGKPLLQHIIEELRDQEIKDIIVNLHYFPDVVKSYFGDGKKFGVHIAYSDETKQLLETGGAIKKAEPLLDDNFLLLYGDNLTFFDFRPLIDLHDKNSGIATTTLRKTLAHEADRPEDADLAEYDPATGRITKWHARPHNIKTLADNLWINAGLYAFSKKIADYIPANASVKLDGEVIPKLIAAGEAIYGLPITETIIDIGKPEKYELAKEYYRKRTSQDSS